MPREARLRRRPPPGRMRVPANAHPRALSQCLRAGGSGDASWRLWRASAVPLRAALACIRQPPSGRLWHVSGRRPETGGLPLVRLWRASRRTAVHAARQPPSASGQLWGASRQPPSATPAKPARRRTAGSLQKFT
jgi:hypothetical protein